MARCHFQKLKRKANVFIAENKMLLLRSTRSCKYVAVILSVLSFAVYLSVKLTYCISRNVIINIHTVIMYLEPIAISGILLKSQSILVFPEK